MRPSFQVGNVFEDLADRIVKTVKDVYDAAVSVILPVLHTLPGGKLVEDAINQGADWVKGIVQLPGANIALVAISNLVYGPLAMSMGGVGWFGPQIASAVWAFPGVVRGQKFYDAWAFQVKDRTEKLAEQVGIPKAKEIFGELPNVLVYLNEKATKEFPQLSLKEALLSLNITPEQLAKELGIDRPDLMALALMMAKGNMSLYYLVSFDVTTGQRPGGDGSILQEQTFTRLERGGGITRYQDLSALLLKRKGGGISFSVSPTTGNRGPIGQILTFALLTAPAWAPVLIKKFRR